MCFSPQRRAIFWTSELQKVVRTCGVLHILTYKCASRHSGVHFFDIWTSKKCSETRQFFSILTSKCAFRHSGVPCLNIGTSKSGPNMWCFAHFDLQMCFRATAACIFSTSELQKVLRDRRFFGILTSKCAFRHSGVHFFDIWTSKSAPRPSVFLAFWLQNVLFATSGVQFLIPLLSTYLRTRRFNRPTFRLTRHNEIIEKTQHFATSLTFGADVSSFFWLSRYCIFFLLTWLLYSAFQLSVLSEVSI